MNDHIKGQAVDVADESVVNDFPDPPDPGGETILGFPINRIVAFIGPYLAVLGGIVADWLTAHVHFLATFHIYGNSVASAFVQLGIFGITAGLIWLGHQKWLEGHHIILANEGLAHTAALYQAQAALAGANQPLQLPPPSPDEIETDANESTVPPKPEEAKATTGDGVDVGEPPAKAPPRGAE